MRLLKGSMGLDAVRGAEKAMCELYRAYDERGAEALQRRNAPSA